MIILLHMVELSNSNILTCEVMYLVENVNVLCFCLFGIVQYRPKCYVLLR